MTLGADGSVLSVTVSEPRFTRREVALLLASRRAEKVPRNRLGVPLHEAMDPANQFAFEVDPPVMDWAMKKRNEVAEAYHKANPKADMDAVHFRTYKR